MSRIANRTSSSTGSWSLSAGESRMLGVAGAVGFALLTALAAQATVPLPGTPVPMTLQTLAVMLAALTLGPAYGSLSMALYVLAGSLGLPVYAQADGGLGVMLGATGGYLIGFVICQPIVAEVARRGGVLNALLALLAGHAVIFALGMTWMWAVANMQGGSMSVTEAFMLGCAPFLIGMMAKTGVATVVGPWLVRFGRRLGW